MSVLAGFCSDLLANKTHLLLLKDREEQTSSVQQDLGAFSSLDFKVSPHSQFLNLFIEKILLRRRGCKLLWIHRSWVQRSQGLRPMANSIGVLPLKVTCVFLTVPAFHIN